MLSIGFLFQDITIAFAFLLVAAIASLYSERTGVINIAVNGNMLIGALVFALFGFYLNKNGQLGNASQFLAVLLAMLAGMALNLLQAFASVSLKANQIVVGTAINILAAAIALFMVTQPGSVDNQYSTNYTLYSIDGFYKIGNVYFLIAIGLAIFTFVFFRYTKVGTRYVGVGENPNAMYAVGMNIIRTRYIALLVSGALGALAGAIFTFSVSNSFNGNVGGEGFLALAVMIFGQWRVQFISLGALLFSGLLGLASWLPLGVTQGWFANNAGLIKALPFVFTIVAIMVFYKYNNQPLADGEPFNEGKRS